MPVALISPALLIGARDPRPRLRQSTAARGPHGLAPSTAASAREPGAGRRVTAGPSPAQGNGDGRQASARRARRATARQGAAFADAPPRAVPLSFPPLRPSPWWSSPRRCSRPGLRLPALPREQSRGLDTGRRPVSCPAIGLPLACPL